MQVKTVGRTPNLVQISDENCKFLRKDLSSFFETYLSPPEGNVESPEGNPVSPMNTDSNNITDSLD